MVRIFCAVSLLLLTLAAGCYEITEDNSRGVATILAGVGPVSTVSFTFTDKDSVTRDYVAYSYNCFTYTAGANNVFHVDGWYLAFGYPGSIVRDVKFLIMDEFFPGNLPKTYADDDSPADLMGRIFLSDYNGYEIKSGYPYTLDLDVMAGSNGRVTGIFSGQMNFMSTLDPGTGTVTNGILDACVRAR